MRNRPLVLVWTALLWASCTGPDKRDGTETWQDLDGEWGFSEEGSARRMAAQVPGTVHTDLMRAGVIRDPYFSTWADSVQWVGDRTWVYERLFDADPDQLQAEQVELVFKGLDTFAEVRLNDSLLGRTDNMFRTWRFPVRGLLRSSANRLSVTFRPAVEEGTRLMERYGRTIPADNDVGPIKVSPFVRKAGFHFGWDFAPRLVTCGIWQAVGLRAWSGGRIESARVMQHVSNGRRELAVVVDLEAPARIGGELLVRLNDRIVATAPVQDRLGWWSQEVIVSLPDTGRWWPAGMGDQRLQHLSVDWKAGGRTLSRWDRSLGLRTVQLDQRPDSIGAPFAFVVNGQRLFMQGANLVPPDMFLPRAGDSTWVRLVRDMQEAHMNMVRVWGGGVYPPDAFFEACDTAGILVWQDLMFANTMVPDDEAFRTNVQEEAADQVRRIQHHACLALWCGNNEVEVAWRNWGWQRSYGMSPADSIRMWNGYSTLFNEILRDWIWVLDRDHAYVPTSPQSNWGSAEGLTKGDLHYWGVWHGDAPFGSFASNVGRFVSEYGFQSYPSWTSIVEWSLPADRAENGPFWKDRQKSYKGDKAITDMAKRYGMKVSDRQDLVEVSQKLQAKAYSSAIGAHQANWPRCAGTLLWQLNDCWPGPSWSIIEYGGRRKPAYTIVQELYAHPPDR